MPEGRRAPGPLWLEQLLRRSTFRVIGAYLQYDAQRHWLRNMQALRDQGWGVAPIFLGASRESYVRKVGRPPHQQRFFDDSEKARWRASMIATLGVEHARTAKALARRAGFAPGSVIWFDNEDPSGVIFVAHELEYYAAFFEELGAPPAYRAGLYAHQVIAAQLLARHPELWIWEVDYGHNVDRTEQPPMRVPDRADPRFGLDPANRDAIIRAFHVAPAPGVSGAGWGCWPVWRQWQGNNAVTLPQSAIGILEPVVKWDWNASLVGDPADPRPTPRLAVAAGGSAAWVAVLEDVDPAFDARGRVAEPRRGRLTLRLPGRDARPVEAATRANWRLHPASAIVPVIGAGVAEMVVVFDVGELGSTIFDGRSWRTVQPLWQVCSAASSPRLPHAIAAAAPTPADLHLVWAATDHQLWTAQRPLAGAWGKPTRMGGSLVLHPGAQIAAVPCGGALHVLSVDRTGALVHLRWRAPDAWPASSAIRLDGPAILPGADLALFAADEGTIVAVALGTDLRLYRWTLAIGDPRARWSAAVPLGEPADTVHAQTRLGISHPQRGAVIVTAIAGDGAPRRFVLSPATGWTATRAVRLDIAADAGAIHPLSDLPSLPDGRLLATMVQPGRASPAMVDPATSAVARIT